MAYACQGVKRNSPANASPPAARIFFKHIVKISSSLKPETQGCACFPANSRSWEICRFFQVL
jgi:hypothetical protein